jgi:hypothetical protein
MDARGIWISALVAAAIRGGADLINKAAKPFKSQGAVCKDHFGFLHGDLIGPQAGDFLALDVVLPNCVNPRAELVKEIAYNR